MQISDQQAQAHVRAAAEALQRGQNEQARAALSQVIASGRTNSQIWLLMAYAERGLGNPEAQEAALDKALALDPGLVIARILKGDCRSAAGDDRTALAFYESALGLMEGHELPRELAIEAQRIEGIVNGWRDRLAERREAALTAAGFPLENRSARFQMAVDILAGKRQIFVQQPTGFYFPELAQIQFFDPRDFPWVAELEAQTDAIRAELAGVLEQASDQFRPYMHGDVNKPRYDDNKLLDNADWSALFLCENGVVNEEMIARCPRTWAAMQKVPAPQVTSSPTVMFSLLKAGARIAAHTGMLNTRLICHLPLIVPPGCRFRVGNETRAWEEGRVMIFDDTIEHEAWNEGSQDRVVLIFDIWRPDLSPREQQEIAALFAASSVMVG